MKITAEPRSDQYNADDFIGGPRDFTIAGVRTGTAEQKYDLLLEGEERCWRPPLTVLRLLMAAWGDEASDWTGKRVRLYRDPTVRFGPEQTGGIRVSHVSGIDKPLVVKVTEKRGKRAPHTLEPLPDAPPPLDIATCTDQEALRRAYQTADAATRERIKARKAELDAQAADDTLPIRDDQ